MEETWYDKEEDILNIELVKKDYWKTVELPSGINIDVAKDGTITGIEILRASKVFSGDVKKVIQQAKPLVAWVLPKVCIILWIMRSLGIIHKES